MTGGAGPDSPPATGAPGAAPAARRKAGGVPLIALTAVPPLLVALALSVANHRLQRDMVYQATVLEARNVMSDVDRELAAVEAGLRALSTAPELQEGGDLAAFHRRATDALKFQIVNNYLLTDAEGRQQLNTLVPYGKPLPAKGTPAALGRVFDTGQSVLTDLFVGPVTGTFVIAMGVPVHRGAKVAYSLNVGLSPDRIASVVDRQVLPEGWIVAVLDRSGTIVARSRDSKRFVGQKAVTPLLQALDAQRDGSLETSSKEGIPVILSYTRSPTSGWAVAIGAPKAELAAGLYRSAAWAGGALLSALLVSMLIARRLAGR